MRLHLISLPHTQTTSEFATCAYTQKIVKFCRMMHDRHEVILYAGDENEAPCAEHVVCVTRAEQEEWFSGHDERDLDRGGFDWNPGSPWWLTMNGRAALEIAKRAEPRDLLLVIAGWAQKPIVDCVPHLTACEWGVGYKGICTNFRAFESYAWKHHVYGLNGIENGVFYDTVIPNFFDVEECTPSFRQERGCKYLLYVGRVIQRKGVHIALQIAEQLQVPLVVAGPARAGGQIRNRRGEARGGWVQAEGFRLESPLLNYIGPVGIRERAELMADASVLLTPTCYLEPFGGVAVEAMLAGTPVVATDFGAFTETVQEGVSGYRFNTLAEGCQAVVDAAALDRAKVRDYAVSRYSLEAVAPMYDRWFNRLDGLWDVGWNAPYHRPASQPVRLLEQAR